MHKDKAVQLLFKIESIFDVEYDGVQLKKALIQGRDTDEFDRSLVGIIQDAETQCGYHVTTGNRFFCGTPIDTNYRKSSPGSLRGSRLINLREAIGEFNDASEVAQKLIGKSWE